MEQDRTMAMMDKAARQAVKVLTSEAAATSIGRDAKTRGPAQAIASAVGAVVDGITKSAAGAGVELPQDVVMGVADAMARLLISMMVASGLAPDPDALMQELQPMLSGGAGEDEEDEGAEEGGESPGEEAMEEARERPAGSLAAMKEVA